MKHIIGIFAHPDDEAFGPSGTLLKESREEGAQIHLICITDGGNGQNPDNVPDLASIRREEWKRAAGLIGATTTHQLGYQDGHLANHLYFDVASRIRSITTPILETAAPDDVIEFMSFDMNGISGHLDHIFASRVCAYVYCTLKKEDVRVTRLRLLCVPREWAPASNCGWLYMDAGRSVDEIDETIDASDYADEVFEIMRAHHSQREDCETHLKAHGREVAINHFIVIK